MPTRANIIIEDYDGEQSTMNFWVQDVSSVNYDSVTQDIDEVKDAALTVIRGEVRSVGFSKTFPESYAAVTDNEAQRESKWLVVYRDTTQFLDAANTIANPGYGKVFNIELATADLTHLDPTAKGEMDLSQDPGLTFKADIEANIRSPYNHGANTPTVEVLRVVHVGRST